MRKTRTSWAFALPAALAMMLAVGACGKDAPAPPPPPDARAPDSGGTPAPSMQMDAAATPDAGPPADAGADARADAGAGDTAPALPLGLALTKLTPLSAARGTPVQLMLGGSSFARDAVVLFEGQPLATTWTAETALQAELPAERTMQPGFAGVQVQNGAAATAERSNVSYFLVTAPQGWPEVVEYQPDHGVPGDTIKIVGFNLSDPVLKIADGAGRLALPGRIGTVAGSNVILESVEFTLPAVWQSGPMTITNTSGAFRAKTFNLGRNLALLPGVKLSASSEYGEGWTIARGADNNLFTSWFPASGHCVSAGPATCTQVPFFLITFPAPQTVGRIALRGNREYTSGYDFLRARFDLLDAAGTVLWSGAYELPEPDRDLDIKLPTPQPNVTSVRFTSERDESEDPGFGELEVFGP